METFKKRAHNLYSIQREEEFMQQTAAQVLPLLLDADAQRNVMSKLGDTKGLQRWMIFRNKTAQDVLPDFDSLKHVLKSGNMRCLKWMLSFKEQVEEVLLSNEERKIISSICQVIQYGYFAPIKQVIHLPRVFEFCSGRFMKQQIVMKALGCGNVKVAEYVLAVLSVSVEDLIEISREVCRIHPECSILQLICNKIGETEFVRLAFPDNKENLLETAVA
eukprot:437893_1